MIKQEMKTVITFRTTAAAMAMEHMCREKKAPGRLIPVPKSISAGCGMAWCADPKEEEFLRKLMEEEGVQPQEICQCMI